MYFINVIKTFIPLFTTGAVKSKENKKDKTITDTHELKMSTNLDKIYGQVGCATSNSLSDFSGNLDDDANTGIFKYQGQFYQCY